jgi:signal transduction histidine kinase
MPRKPTVDPQPPQSRQQTDQSLQMERAATDTEIARRQDAITAKSEEVVDRARQRADDVLEDARDRADQVLERQGSTTSQRRTLKTERASEDAALREERSTADEEADRERAERQRALDSLLRLEREITDERLLLERAGGDAMLDARDDLMGMVSHDVRNLLGGIALAAELQIKTATDDAAGKRAVETAQRIRRFTARINRLIGDLVDVASIEANRFSVMAEPGDARALIRESLEAFGPLLEDRQVELVAEGDLDEEAVAVFDHDRILQVLANLVGNAIKFTPPGGRVTLRMRRGTGEVELSVQDTGQGVSPQDLTHLFEQYWQAQKGDARGMGLGLFISQRIVEAHGGRIRAQSVVGEGSTFLFTLPAPD